LTVVFRVAVWSASAALLCAQGTPPKTSPSDYSAHAALDNGFSIAADYLVRSLPTPGGTLVADDYLVVDAMFFGPLQPALKMSAGHFLLRINGQKVPLTNQSTGMVAASIKDPNWAPKPGVTVIAGSDNRDVVYGPRSPVESFPGDPTVGHPQQPRVPDPETSAGLEKEPEMPIEERLVRSAMPETERVAPAGGLLFFSYRGKTKSIKSVELIYEGPSGKATLTLLPVK
jgi:hypothetical protein